MEQITVTIPYTGPFNRHKYVADDGQRCYLEEALDKAGYKGSVVSAVGRVKINGKPYDPKEDFDSDVLRKAFDKGESVTVTLVPR